MIAWKDAVQAEVSRDPRGIAGVAKRIGMKRTALSMLLSGTYPGNNTWQLNKVLLWLGQGSLECPHLRKPISEGDCIGFRTRPQPRSDPAGLRHWVDCQDCPLGAALLTRNAAQAAPSDPARSAQESDHAA